MVTEPSATYLILGPTTVAVGSRAVDLGSPQRRGVLARMILAPGRSLSVDALARALWGERLPPTARKAVQVQISKLRQVLPDGAIQTSAAGYSLHVDAADTDLGRFEQLVRTAQDQPDAASRSVELHRALALWRGPALADVADLPFAGGEAARLEELRQQALDARFRADLELGDHARIVAELEGLVGLHPEREPLWEHLMRALYALGRQADALRAYERARSHLNEDLGLEPGPSLQALQLAVLRHDDELLPRPPVTPAPAAGPRPAPARSKHAAPALVGREPEMEVLRAAIERSAAEQVGTLVVVEADEGFGKTALLTAIAEEVSSSATVLSTRSREDHAAPYAPWVEVLDQLGATEVRSLLDGWTDQNQTGEWRRNQLFHGVGANIAQAAAGRPVVLLLDDAHWADEGTTRLLLHVLAETSAERVTTIIAWRPREVKVGVPAVALAEHVAKRRAPRVALGALDETDIGTLLERQRGDAAPAAADLPKRIFEVTSGVPLFVEDVITSAAADDRPLDGDIAQIPETARSITVRRLTGAGEVATEVAKAASLLAEPISLDVLPDLVPELSVEVVLDGVDRLVEYGLLRETPAGPTFVHATFRSAVRDSIPAGRRLVLHANAFHRLALEPVPAAALAQHAEDGGRLVPPADAAAALDRAGREAGDRGAFVDASRFFEREVALAPEPVRAAALLHHADALWRAGDLATAKAVASSVADLRAARPDLVPDDALARAVGLHGTIGAGFGPDPSSIALASAALGALVDPTARGRCAVALAYHQAAWGAPSTVVEAALTQARQELPDPCPDDLMDEVAFTDGLANLRSPDLDDRRDHAHLLADRGRARQDLRSVGRGLRLLCMAHLSAGDLESVEEDATELETVAIRTGSWMYQSDVLRCRSAVALARNDLDGLRGCIAELDRLAADPLAGWVFVGTQRLLLSHAEGDLTTALHFVDAVRTALPPQGAWQTDRMLADLYRIRLLFEMGEPDQARGELDELAPWKELHLSCCRRYPSELALMSTAVASAGRADVAAQLLPLVEPFRGQQVVLGWGEGLIGSFEDCWRSLDVLAGAGAGAGTVEPDARPADQPLA